MCVQDPHVGARGVTGKVALNRTLGGGYQQPTYAPGASYAPKISMGRPSTAAPIMRGGSQNYTIKAAANGDYINNFGTGDIVCNREFFTMTEDRPIVKEVCLDISTGHNTLSACPFPLKGSWALLMFPCQLGPYCVLLSHRLLQLPRVITYSPIPASSEYCWPCCTVLLNCLRLELNSQFLMMQIKDYVRENRVFEKQFVKETRFTGNETQKGITDTVELSNRDSIIEATPAAAPCVGCGCADC